MNAGMLDQKSKKFQEDMAKHRGSQNLQICQMHIEHIQTLRNHLKNFLSDIQNPGVCHINLFNVY